MMGDTMDVILSQKAGETEMILVAGDGDYVPAVNLLIQRGFKVTVCFWNHASRELKEAASGFFSLDPHVEQISR